MFTVYVLKSLGSNNIYVGQTGDLDKRLERHNNGGSKATARYKPWKIVLIYNYQTRTAALKREKELKSSRGRNFIRQQLGSASVG